jgi:hypothetical protein
MGLICLREERTPDCQPEAPMRIAVNAPIDQKTAFATLGLPMVAPTFPFMERCNARMIPRNRPNAKKIAFIYASSIGFVLLKFYRELNFKTIEDDLVYISFSNDVKRY